MAIQWLEAHVKENNSQEKSTRQQLQELDCLKDLAQKKTNATVVRVCQETYVETQQSVQCVSAGHWSRSFYASFCNSSECSDHRREKNF